MAKCSVGGYSAIISHVFDWSPGDFGDRGSCFWTVRSAGRDGMKKDDRFYSMRVFEDGNIENGIARCWIFYSPDELPDTLIVFNAYGYQTSVLAHMLKRTIGADYCRQIALTNNGYQNGGLWINNDGTGFLVSMSDSETDSFDMSAPGTEAVCDLCERMMLLPHAYDGPDGEKYCERCFLPNVFCVRGVWRNERTRIGTGTTRRRQQPYMRALRKKM